MWIVCFTCLYATRSVHNEFLGVRRSTFTQWNTNILIALLLQEAVCSQGQPCSAYLLQCLELSFCRLKLFCLLVSMRSVYSPFHAYRTTVIKITGGKRRNAFCCAVL